MTRARIRLLIADDHPVVRAGVRGMVESQHDFEVIGEARDGLEAVELTVRELPHVVLMDLRIPKIDGVEATRRIKGRAPTVQVLVLTTYDSDADIVAAVEAGAVGYLLKDAPREELFQGVRAAAQGRPAWSRAVTAKLNERLHAPERRALSVRELEVLQHAAGGASNREIGRALAISEATVKSHLIRIYQKLDVSDRTAAVTMALERGIIRL